MTPSRERVVVLDFCYSGPLESAEAQRWRCLSATWQAAFGDDLKAVRYTELQTQDDERARFGRHYYTRSGLLTRIEPGLIDVMNRSLRRGAGAPAAASHCRRRAAPSSGSRAMRPRCGTAMRLHSVIFQASGDDGSGDIENTAMGEIQLAARSRRFTSGRLCKHEPRGLGRRSGSRLRMAAITTGWSRSRASSIRSNLFRLNPNIQPRA